MGGKVVDHVEVAQQWCLLGHKMMADTRQSVTYLP